VRPPGHYAGYSNYNADLAGYIVARVSGMPYEQYIRQEILDPLGMAYTAIESVPPPDMNDRIKVYHLISRVIIEK
jgi:CubicO group peptidase (beta-lactamase class C family)